MIEIICWASFGYVLMSFIEHQIHQKLMHRSSWLAERFWEFRSIFKDHALMHHGKFYEKFDHEPDPWGREMNIHLNTVTNLAIASPILLLLNHYSPAGAWTLGIVLVLHHFLWNVIHEEMHIPKRKFFRSWPIFKYLARYHFLHHQHRDTNYNVVCPFADNILGTRAIPTYQDYVEMERMGLIGYHRLKLD